MEQVAAQKFCIPISLVHIADTTTDKVPNASPTAASASSDLYGQATFNACEEIMQRLEKYIKEEQSVYSENSTNGNLY